MRRGLVIHVHDADWNESDHPRDKGGQFAETAGGGAGAAGGGSVEEQRAAAKAREHELFGKPGKHSWAVRFDSGLGMTVEGDTEEEARAKAYNRSTAKAGGIKEITRGDVVEANFNAGVAKLEAELKRKDDEQEERELIEHYRLPAGSKFVEGKGALASGKWGVELPDGRLAWNLADTKAQAAREAKEAVDREQLADARKRAAKMHAENVAVKLRAGAEPTDHDIALLGLKKGSAGFPFLSAAVQEVLGIGKGRVREAMGDALTKRHSDMGATYYYGDPKKALMNAAAWQASRKGEGAGRKR